jgi:hypothetical protein
MLKKKISLKKKGGTQTNDIPIYRRLEFNEFPRVWGIITIPADFILYRGGTKEPNLGSDPRFFSDFNTANVYTMRSNTYKTYGCITNELKLVDLRTLRYLFWEYVGYNRLYFTSDQLKLINKALFALGLLSIDEQYNFMLENKLKIPSLQIWLDRFPTLSSVKSKYNCSALSFIPSNSKAYNILGDHYASFGNRISECSIDDEVVALLKIIFGDTIDGYISPILDSVWHEFQFNPELCLFEPKKSLKMCSIVPLNIINPDIIFPPMSISLLLNVTSEKIISGVAGNFNYIKKGGTNSNQNIKKNNSGIIACEIFNKEKQEAFIESIPLNFANENEKSIEENVKKIWDIDLVQNVGKQKITKKVEYNENLFATNV